MLCEKIVNGNLICGYRAKGGPREAVTLGAGRVALCEAHAQAEYRRRGRCPWPRPATERVPTSYAEKWAAMLAVSPTHWWDPLLHRSRERKRGDLHR